LLVKASLGLLAGLFVWTIARPSLAGLPEEPGTFATESQTFDIPVAADVNLSTDVRMPKTTGARPLVILRHGYTSYKANMIGWADHLASHGFVGVSFESRDPNNNDSATDGADMAKLVEWLVQRATDNASPLFGRIDTARIAIGGHSAGGATAMVAASKVLPKVLVLLDTEDSAPALAVAKNLSAPTVALFAEASGCNEDGDNRKTFAAVTGPRFGVFVPGATHCDGEDPIDVDGCGSFCGAPTAANHAKFKRYATAFLQAYLLCDSAAYPYVNGAQATSDTGIKILPETANLQLPPPECSKSPGADGGPTTGDGGAGGPGGGGPGGGAGNPDASSGVSPTQSGDDGGCGCAVPGATESPTWLVLLGSVSALSWLRHRRRRARHRP
jgi:MYXO-CTERM domain-containing protein